ncbi:hypothetical protein LCGC14_2419500 [marine sediment metagenome]|uniref:Uncharacterized protein n=1 Tax=marine sediment metagenome TaxID=412755 RepID=A0A0F9CCA0_9ZZZZ
MSGTGHISAEPPKTCELCGVHEECRPYGPNGEDVCFSCGMKDEAAAKRGFMKYIFGSDEEG